MGETDRENVKWLLQFAQLEIPAQTLGTLIDLTNTVHSLPLTTGQARGIAAWAPHLGIGKGHTFEPPIAFLQSLQQRLCAGLATLDAGQSWRLPDHPSQWFLIPDPETGDLRKQYVSETEPAFFAAVVDLLVGAWPALRRCLNPTCVAPRFLPTKPRQKYCSPRCSEKVRQATYRPKRKRDYQVEYEKRVAKRLPPGARVKVHGRLTASTRQNSAPTNQGRSTRKRERR